MLAEQEGWSNVTLPLPSHKRNCQEQARLQQDKHRTPYNLVQPTIEDASNDLHELSGLNLSVEMPSVYRHEFWDHSSTRGKAWLFKQHNQKHKGCI